jgi:hypothetical protein
MNLQEENLPTDISPAASLHVFLYLTKNTGIGLGLILPDRKRGIE